MRTNGIKVLFNNGIRVYAIIQGREMTRFTAWSELVDTDAGDWELPISEDRESEDALLQGEDRIFISRSLNAIQLDD